MLQPRVVAGQIKPELDLDPLIRAKTEDQAVKISVVLIEERLDLNELVNIEAQHILTFIHDLLDEEFVNLVFALAGGYGFLDFGHANIPKHGLDVLWLYLNILLDKFHKVEDLLLQNRQGCHWPHLFERGLHLQQRLVIIVAEDLVHDLAVLADFSDRLTRHRNFHPI